MITALTQPSADALRSEIRRAKSMLKSDSLTLGVNLTLLPSLVPPDYPAYANVVVEEGIRVVETAGHYKGLEPFVKLFKQHNIRVIHKCTQVRHAQSAASMGTPLCPTCYACTCCGCIPS
jgi:NAD(P)H-dependent flavin oxidoreductase YrpB (nitropropane dioxygenase family)